MVDIFKLNVAKREKKLLLNAKIARYISAYLLHKCKKDIIVK